MTKYPPIPRLSIVVPVGCDAAAFEATLVSVLENQPDGSEVIVCHDGDYDDPFSLAGEVRFVTAASNDLVDAVSAGATAAHGRFVHVLADGLRATDGWADSALEKFEHHDAGVVAPVIRSGLDQVILGAGWHDSADRLCKANASGKRKVSAGRKNIGAYLTASFWRRDLLRSLGKSCDLRDELEACYAYEWMSRDAGWRCVLADESNVISDHDSINGDESSWSRGTRLRAIRSSFQTGGWSKACKASMIATIANGFRPSMFAESIGQVFAPLSEASITKSLRPQDVVASDDGGAAMIHRMPERSFDVSRRAA
ncbi:glycosyltransferase [Rubripirellula tenax]|uniref:glycosyltransferase n=1 Tax=Rubripirellula tenax TaxID=2528015 RepID=UPI0011B44282|nr:glycosyltransferase [Rubripirellula tenax]